MTLTEASYYARKFAPFAIFAFVVVLIFFYSIKLLFLLLSLNQPKTVYINPIFKEIKPIAMKKEATTSAGFSFTLDTVEGQPVTATETANVYLLPQSKFQFDYLPRVYLMAKMLGFDTEVVKHKLVNNDAIFEDGKRKLTVDINTYNFRFDYDFRKDYELVADAAIPNRDELENVAVNFLNSIDRYPKELSLGKTNAIYLNYDKVSSSAAVVDEPQLANMIEIDFYRPDVGQYPSVSSSYFNSQNYVMIMASQTQSAKVISAQMKFFERSEDQVGIYPLMTGQQAYERLLAGKGILISAGSGKKNVAIKKMFLGYYDPDIYQEYYQPVYIFLGDNNFVSYVPAVSDTYLIDESKL